MAVKRKRKSQISEIWKRFRKNKTALAGLIIFSVILFLSIFADIITPYSKGIEQNMPIRLQGPSMEHPFGTDAFGRDVFSRILHGGRNSLFMGVVAVMLGISIGGLLGAFVGYIGGIVDTIFMRVVDTIICIPFMLMALALITALGTGMANLVLVLVIAMIPAFVRLLRGTVLTVVGQDYIEAAKACGTPLVFIILRHIIPNSIGTVIVQATMSVASMIIWAAGMSFLGMGIQPPTPEWGAILSDGREYMLYAPHIIVIAGIAILLASLSINLMGDGLRDALDPRLKD